jgi:hypothetical protein
MVAIFLFLKGMTGALAPLSYLVIDIFSVKQFRQLGILPTSKEDLIYYGHLTYLWWCPAWLHREFIKSIGAMLRSSSCLALPARGFSIRILLFGWMELNHPQ